MSGYIINFTKEAQATLKKWKKSNPKLLSKALVLLDELVHHPKEGLGHPEPLKEGGGRIYSRRINKQHRLVYEIFEEKILILVISFDGHYGDK